MFRTCPKCGYERKAADEADPGICGGCGLVFAKWVNHTLGVRPVAAIDEEAGGGAGAPSALLARLTSVESSTDPIHFWGRVAAYVVLVIWGCYFIALDWDTNEIGHSFMHRVNLVFHEAGHVLCMPFGSFMATLGGTLGQLLMPIVVGCALVIRNHDNFGGSVGLWWLAQSVMDCAPYIGDARALQLMLLGGGTGQDRPGAHDWENILLDLNLIQHDTRIAAATDALGSALMLIAFLWGGYILFQQYRILESRH